MMEKVNPIVAERVVLAGLLRPGQDAVLFEEDLQEMVMLCTTARAEVMERIVQKRAKPIAGTYFGSGKLEEIAESISRHKCSTLVVDAELTPGQIRNIEECVKAKVIDRGQLILDIFALNASTNEARVQVELAQMRTLYPRLSHAWTHFSKQVGGIGTRGPGEKQLEVDRRLVQRKITELRRRLDDIEKSRRTRSLGRSELFKIALVGYTNVGKSSLLNRLCGSDVMVENKLFATLDTATRRTWLPGSGSVVISDTVGFLRKLPHHLVASFRSTLEVVLETDLLVVVMDASSEWYAQQLTTVNEVLDQLGAGAIQRLLVFNKADLVQDPFVRKQLEVNYPGVLFVSAQTAEGIDPLREVIAAAVVEHEKNRTMQSIIEQKTRSYNDEFDDPTNYDPQR
jgi:GTP-binding protein HflX